MTSLVKSVYPIIKLYKNTTYSPSKYKWKVDKKKDSQHEMVEATVFNRKTNEKVLYLVGSKAIGQNNYSLSVNFFADNV